MDSAGLWKLNFRVYWRFLKETKIKKKFQENFSELGRRVIGRVANTTIYVPWSNFEEKMLFGNFCFPIIFSLSATFFRTIRKHILDQVSKISFYVSSKISWGKKCFQKFCTLFDRSRLCARRFRTFGDKFKADFSQLHPTYPGEQNESNQIFQKNTLHRSFSGADCFWAVFSKTAF